MMVAQTRLNLDCHQRTVLVGMDTVKAIKGFDSETIWTHVENGDYLWVWDVSAAPAGPDHQRELRFWARQFLTPGHGLLTSEVVDMVIGTSAPRLRAAFVAHLLIVSHAHTMRLVRRGALEGPLIGHTQFISRESLARFLTIRLVR